jgi:hypothetical protein
LDPQGRPTALSPQDLQRIEEVALNSLLPTTQATYGTGLLAFHVFCDSRDIAEDLRAPVSDLILKSFVSKLAGIYSSSAITNYVAAVRAWHIIHGVGWNVEGLELDAVIKGAKSLAPPASSREKRKPITVEHIEKIHAHLSQTEPLDVAVFACLTSAFWATARLGEVTVKTLTSFNPDVHVKRSDLKERVDRRGLEVTEFHVPQTKASRTEGESLYWARQEGVSDPEGALQRHLEINNPPANAHLFGYHNKKKEMVPLTKTTFVSRLTKASKAAGLDRMHGHSIRIGSTMEYLLRGLPFDVMKAKGRWNSDAFHKYLRDHATVLAPYMQAAPPDVHDEFVRIAVPSAR